MEVRSLITEDDGAVHMHDLLESVGQSQAAKEHTWFTSSLTVLDCDEKVRACPSVPFF
jgi:hypothetical protein